MPSGRPWNIDESGKRIRVAANAPPKMTMKACDVDEHPQIAAHQDEADEHDAAERKPEAGCDIHGPLQTQRTRTRRGIARCDH